MFEFFVYLITILFVLIVACVAFYYILVIPGRSNTIKKLIAEKRYEDARFLINDLLKRNPRNSEMLYILGKIQWESNEKSLAISTIEKAIANDKYHTSPFREFSLYCLATFYKEEEKWDKSETIIKNLLEKSPKNAKYQALMGEILVGENNPEEALEFLIEAKTLAPQNIDIHKKIGKTFFNLGQFDEAKESFSDALSLDEKDVETLSYLAKISEIMSDINDSIDLYKKIIRIDSGAEAFNASIKLGELFMSQNKDAEAVLVLEKAERLLKSSKAGTISEQKEKELLYQLGEYYSKHKSIDFAIETWRKILAKDKNYKDVQEKIKKFSSKQVKDLFRDILTHRDESLFNILSNFIKSLEYTIDNYQPFGLDVVDITVYNLSDKISNSLQYKIIFSFWCSHDKYPADIIRRFNSYLSDTNIDIIVISTGPIMSEQREELKSKQIKFFDETNIEEFIDERRKKLESEKRAKR